MDRKQEILDSAEQLSRARGYDGFSYADIEKEVGIRKASIHHHFSSKSALGMALLERYGSRVLESLAQIRRSNDSGGQQLLRFIDEYRQALSGGRTLCLCVAFSAGRDSLDTPILSELSRLHGLYREWLQIAFESGRTDGSIANVADSADEAAAALALVEGAQIVARADERLALFDQAVASLEARAR